MTETKEDIIRRYAFNIYQKRTRLGFMGNEKTDWLEAELMYEQEKLMAERKGWV